MGSSAHENESSAPSSIEEVACGPYPAACRRLAKDDEQMNNVRTMKTTDIYRHLRTLQCDSRRADRLVALFHRSAIFLVDKVQREGWKWRTNYLREHAGCAFGATFTNTLSPYINELLFRQYPDLRRYENTDTGELLPF